MSPSLQVVTHNKSYDGNPLISLKRRRTVAVSQCISLTLVEFEWVISTLRSFSTWVLKTDIFSPELKLRINVASINGNLRVLCRRLTKQLRFRGISLSLETEVELLIASADRIIESARAVGPSFTVPIRPQKGDNSKLLIDFSQFILVHCIAKREAMMERSEPNRLSTLLRKIVQDDYTSQRTWMNLDALSVVAHACLTLAGCPDYKLATIRATMENMLRTQMDKLIGHYLARDLHLDSPLSEIFNEILRCF